MLTTVDKFSTTLLAIQLKAKSVILFSSWYTKHITPNKGKSMDTITISKNEFIQFITEGFALDLSEQEKQEFYSAFTFYVNSDDNDFVADLTEEGVFVHAGMKTEMCQVKYSDGKIIILTAFNDGDEYFSSEFSAEECRTILAQACHGIVTFTKTYAIATGKLTNDSTGIPVEKLVGDNSNSYKPWIM